VDIQEDTVDSVDIQEDTVDSVDIQQGTVDIRVGSGRIQLEEVVLGLGYVFDPWLVEEVNFL